MVCGRRGKTSRGRLASLQLAAPAGPCGRPLAGSGSSHSNPRSAGVPNADRGVQRQWVGSVTRKGIAFGFASSQDIGVACRRGQIQFRTNVATSRWGSNTVLFFSMK